MGHGTCSTEVRKFGILHRSVKANSALLNEVLNRYILLNNKGYCATSGPAWKTNVFISPLLLSDLWGMSQHGPQPLGQHMTLHPSKKYQCSTRDLGTCPSNFAHKPASPTRLSTCWRPRPSSSWVSSNRTQNGAFLSHALLTFLKVHQFTAPK